MSTTKKPAKVEYKAERNTRMASYKGRWNCEILLNGKFFCDGQGDTAEEAKMLAQVKLKKAIREGRVNASI